MIVLGVHCGFTLFNHEPGAAISKNGKIIASCEEERYTRNKEAWGNLPIFSIKAALRIANINFNQVDLVVSTGVTAKGLKHKLQKFFKENFNHCPKIILVHHQLAHISSAFYSSGFEKATCLSLDGFGDGKSGLISEVSLKKGIKEIEYIEKKDSIGNFYTMVTEFLGYHTGDEYKVMGLAAYGKKTVDFSKVISFKKNYWKCDDKFYSGRQSPYLNTYSEKFEKLFKKYKRNPNQKINQLHKNFAASAQGVVNFALLKIFNYSKSISKYKEKICFAGGVALNCSAMRELLYSGIFQNIYIPPNPSDRGLPIGCAYFGSTYLKDKPKKLITPFLGNKYSDKQIKKELKNNNCIFSKLENPSKAAASFLSKGKIIGWFQGRSEIGARALGNRSILANPLKNNMKKILNAKIKYREEFRPFAPAVTIEEAENYFKTLGNEIPFMNCTVNANPKNSKKIPSAIHIDNTSRVQTVNKKLNPKFYNLIKQFKRLTGIPVVINTSFNLKGQPIVETPRDALMTFFGSGIDYLIIGSFLVKKKN